MCKTSASGIVIIVVLHVWRIAFTPKASTQKFKNLQIICNCKTDKKSQHQFIQYKEK